MGDYDREITFCVWTTDFIRALRERPLIVKVLLRLLMGKYAYREFIGVMDSAEISGYTPYFNYELEKQNYHKDKLPRLNWWNEREPIKKK